MSNPALHFFQRRHENIRLAARGADVALLSDADGYVTYGQDADRVVEAMKRRVLPVTLGSDDIGPFRSVVLPPDRVAEAVKAMNEHGWSVALIDRNGARMVCVAIVPAVKGREEAFV
jgi:hypothetical protein